MALITILSTPLLGQRTRIIPQVVAGEFQDKDVRTILVFKNNSSESCSVDLESFGNGNNVVSFNGETFSTLVTIPANGSRQVIVTLADGTPLNDFAVTYRTNSSFRQCESTVQAQVTYRFVDSQGRLCTTYNYTAPPAIRPGGCVRLTIDQKSSGNEPNSMFGLAYGALDAPRGASLHVKVFDNDGMEIASGTLPVAGLEHHAFLLPQIMSELGADPPPADFQGSIQICPKVPTGTDPGDFQVSVTSINTVLNEDGSFHYEVSRQDQETAGCQPGNNQICGSGVAVQVMCDASRMARFLNWKQPHAKAEYACSGLTPEAWISVDVPSDSDRLDVIIRPIPGQNFNQDAAVQITGPSIQSGEPLLLPLSNFLSLQEKGNPLLFFITAPLSMSEDP